MPQMKEQEKSGTKQNKRLNEIETSSLPETEFKKLELSKNINKQ